MEDLPYQCVESSSNLASPCLVTSSYVHVQSSFLFSALPPSPLRLLALMMPVPGRDPTPLSSCKYHTFSSVHIDPTHTGGFAGLNSPQQGETIPKKSWQAKVSKAQRDMKSKGTTLKRSLPVAWGKDVPNKVPRFAERFSSILEGRSSSEQAKGRKRLYGKQPDPLACSSSELPRPPE